MYDKQLSKLLILRQTCFQLAKSLHESQEHDINWEDCHMSTCNVWRNDNIQLTKVYGADWRKRLSHDTRIDDAEIHSN